MHGIPVPIAQWFSSGCMLRLSTVFSLRGMAAQSFSGCTAVQFRLYVVRVLYGSSSVHVNCPSSGCTMVHFQLPNGTVSSVRWSMWLYDKPLMNVHDWTASEEKKFYFGLEVKLL